MEGRRFLESIRLDRILSFGPNDEAFELQPLNVLIGPNASGKSNLIEALSVLHAAPRDLQAPTREGGGVREWMWKGGNGSSKATVDATLQLPTSRYGKPIAIRYLLAFKGDGGIFRRFSELLGSVNSLNPCTGPSDVYQSRTYYSFDLVEGLHFIDEVGSKDGNRRDIPIEHDVQIDQSILSQRRDPKAFPELTYLANSLEGMWFFREWNFGRFSPVRQTQRTDLEQDRLLEDASNLGLVLNNLQNQPTIKSQLLDRMRDFYPQINDIHTNIIGGTVQIFFHEKGLREAIPASRLSDGSLKYLCLLAVLLHPEPPNVICIEEPELGLHPDIIPEVGKLLIEASKRSQIFVTTHSDILVDSLSEVPEAVVVCEKVDGATQLRRLDGESLKPWLEKYRLGELWTSGEIGGNRW